MSEEKDLVDLLVQNLDVGNGSSSAIRNGSSSVTPLNTTNTSSNSTSNNSSTSHSKQQRKGKQRHGSNRNSIDADVYGRQNQPYMYNSRDREWAEYVQFMNLPGLAISPAHAFPQQTDALSNPINQQNGTGIPIPAYLTPQDGGGVYNQPEADFVQNFVGNSAPQYVPYLHPGYFQHPNFPSQVYNGQTVFSANNFYPYQQFAMVAPDPSAFEQQYKQQQSQQQQQQQQNYSSYASKAVQPPQPNSSNEKTVQKQSDEQQSDEALLANLNPQSQSQNQNQNQKAQTTQQPSGPKSWAQIATNAATKPPPQQPPVPSEL
jgi:hypothetical protein